jgi:hypothetical protein
MEGEKMSEIVKGNIGTVGNYNVKFESGKVVIEANAAQDYGSVGIVLKLDAAVILDAMAKAIPGQLDDMLFGAVKSSLLK